MQLASICLPLRKHNKQTVLSVCINTFELLRFKANSRSLHNVILYIKQGIIINIFIFVNKTITEIRLYATLNSNRFCLKNTGIDLGDL